MGFWDEIIALYILGVLCNYFAITKGFRRKNKAWGAYYSTFVVGIILIYGILMYVGALNGLLDLYNRILWIASDPFVNGKDYMWNSFRFVGFNPNIDPTLELDSIAVLLFLCYIPVYVFGRLTGRFLFGGKTYEKGIAWALAPVPKPK